MNIELNRIPTDFKGEFCFTHARGAITPDGFGVMTTQPLLLSGSDVFYDMYISTTHDGGKTWSELKKSNTLIRTRLEDGKEMIMADATPMYHKKSGKIILIGARVTYISDKEPTVVKSPGPMYSVYDEKSEDFLPAQILELPTADEDSFFYTTSGCVQSLEEENGDLLIPVCHVSSSALIDSWKSFCHSSVTRCSFDGEKLSFIEIGNSLTAPVPRGCCEPSISYHNGFYYLALRNDVTGYIARGVDGIHFDDPVELVFDDGENAGNYNTQQHWINGGDRLYLVYTRRAENNSHVFRHRAPLFIAEYDGERMCLLRNTERIAVPERGARLGNFGCMSMEEKKLAFVFVSEWMQTTPPDPYDWRVCTKYGSDNSIFIARISFE